MLTTYNKILKPAYHDDFFNDLVSRRYYGNNFATSPAVNIIEENDEFRIEVAAAGLSKKDIKIDLNDNVLSISAEHTEKKKKRKKK